MELDKRIKDITDIESVTDGYSEIYINNTGYFADNIIKFKDLRNCIHGTCIAYDGENDQCFLVYVEGESSPKQARYFIPESRLESAFRPYTDKEFLTLFDLGKFHSIRVISEPYNRIIITSIYYSTDDTLYIRVNGKESGYGILWLFKYCEYFDGEDWKPFGIKE